MLRRIMARDLSLGAGLAARAPTIGIVAWMLAACAPGRGVGGCDGATLEQMAAFAGGLCRGRRVMRPGSPGAGMVLKGSERIIEDEQGHIWHESCLIEAANVALETGGEIIDTTEAAKRLGISRRRVCQLIEDGRLPAHKLARDFIVRAKDLERPEVLDRQVAYPAGRPRTRTDEDEGDPESDNED